ncbi:cleavage stimulating factor 64 [Lactuca sativa]|uniref:Cleavage stimulation factor subunit 2 hinge domain-containing protein n=1 Tax=Lactuca sativa TaxID=4236 RepID=A0A9R1WIF0_LACSA|nr:cleavage stimulating factor 64 [Lactuca sativa]KAJ0223332.1 hypothetical protein LSAT_V11C200055890 [Lactuca sativa]
MAGNQATGDGLSVNIAGMSKNQLYDIMSQMKTLIEQNQDQARQILIQNPLLTKALFQAQIMLGMLQPPQEIPNIQPTGTHHPQPAPPPAPPLQNQPPQQNHTTISTPPPSSVSPSLPPLQPPQHGRAQIKPQAAPMAAHPSHYSTQPPPLPPASTPLQQPLHISNISHLPLQPPLQPPLPPQPRPPSMQTFPHQNYSHMGPTSSFQHPGGPQLHHSQQPMFHSGSRPPTSMGPPFSQSPNQQLSQGLYQGGGSHVGMDFNQMGVPSQQPERGSNWMPENAVGPTATSSFLPAHMTSATQLPRPPSLTADMEKALLQQVMSLTPDQVNQLPPDQRNQVLQLQQMLRQ